MEHHRDSPVQLLCFQGKRRQQQPAAAMTHAQDSPNCSVAFHTLTANAYLSPSHPGGLRHCHNAYGMSRCLVYTTECVVCIKHIMSVACCIFKLMLRHALPTHGRPHIAANSDSEAH